MWGTLFLVTLLWGGSLYNSFVYAAAASRQKISAGIIIGYRSEDHARYDYTFSVNGTNYTGRDYYLRGSEGARAVGREVKVYYDPTSPETNGLSDLNNSAAFIQPIAAWLFAVLLFNGIAYLDWQRRRSKAAYS
jgi:hypothetical protein